MILPIEKQVASRDLSEKLRELGFPQETYFYYSVPIERSLKVCPQDKISLGHWDIPPTDSEWFKRIAAPTVAELGEVLKPKKLQIKCESGYTVSGDNNNWYCEYDDRSKIYGDYTTYADTEADARAKLLIYLAEEGLVKFKEAV